MRKLLIIVAVLLGAFLILNFISAIFLTAIIPRIAYRSFYVPGGSMSPTILVGDHILAGPGPVAVYNEPDYGDVVVFIPPGYPGASFIKRLIGLPGDTVQITGGLLFIDGLQMIRWSRIGQRIL